MVMVTTVIVITITTMVITTTTLIITIITIITERKTLIMVIEEVLHQTIVELELQVVRTNQIRWWLLLNHVELRHKGQILKRVLRLRLTDLIGVIQRSTDQQTDTQSQHIKVDRM